MGQNDRNNHIISSFVIVAITKGDYNTRNDQREGTIMNSRQKYLVKLLEEQGDMELGKMVEELGVSEATVRRDLHVLEEAGQLLRTLGGAKLLEPPSLVVRTFEEKWAYMRLEKERIARAAAEFVQPGMIVALDSGTTAWRVAAALKEKSPLTIVTAALAPIEELGSVEGITVHCVGGRFRLDNLDFVGYGAVAAVEELRADIAFLGADGFVAGKGAYSTDEASAALAGALARCADGRIVVTDHTKFAAKGHCLVVEATDLHCVITDAGLDKTTREALEADPYEVVVV